MNGRWTFCLMCLLAVGSGCGRFRFIPQEGASVTPILSPEQQQALASRSESLQRRTAQLDAVNQEQVALLGQSRQQINLLEDELRLARQQLQSTTQLLADSRQNADQLKHDSELLAASVQRRVGASIHANNSLLRDLSLSHLPGVKVQQDGDVVRIQIADEQLFQAGSAVLSSKAGPTLQAIVGEISSSFPRQIVGIEGHVDSGLIRTAQFASGHHLSVAKATSVHDFLTQTLRFPPTQLFIIGHGGNHPLVSNATEEGKRRNRRIEIVIYPQEARR